jgi:uncharacterized membrane protein YadS
VFLPLPVVLSVGWYFTKQGMRHGEAHVPVPVFAIVVLVLCVVNSAMPLTPSLLPVYAPVKSVLVEKCFFVMAGLVPAIHVFVFAYASRRGCPRQARA